MAVLPLVSLEYFTPAFVFLFILISAYALLKKSKWFGDSESVNLCIAFLTSVLFMIVPEAVDIVAFVTPWVAILAMLVLFIIVLFLFMGAKEADVVKVVTKNTAVLTILFVLLGVIFLTALTNVFGPFLMVGDGAGFWGVTKRVIFHPRTLGLVFLLVIASYAIRFITAEK